MAVYKVAQDVEADDKLLGPFTARQFIYLVVVAMSGALSFFLGQLFLPLFVIPLPVLVFFGALALPLKKDQPMEVYLAAIVSYNLKPRKRFWIPDGLTSLVEITAPQAAEQQLTKTFAQGEAEQRLSYLADIVDTEGWAVRHAVATNTSMISDVYNDAQATTDPLDVGGTVGSSIGSMLDQASEKHRQEVIEQMHHPDNVAPQAAPVASAANQQWFSDPYANLSQQPAAQPAFPPMPTTQPSDVHFNPYPTSIHQSVVQPLSSDDQITGGQTMASQPVPEPAYAAPVTTNSVSDDTEDDKSAKSTSETTVTPDIIKLVNNSDLSIETIAREAHRIKDKDEGDEVVISLR